METQGLERVTSPAGTELKCVPRQAESVIYLHSFTASRFRSCALVPWPSGSVLQVISAPSFCRAAQRTWAIAQPGHIEGGKNHWRWDGGMGLYFLFQAESNIVKKSGRQGWQWRGMLCCRGRRHTHAAFFLLRDGARRIPPSLVSFQEERVNGVEVQKPLIQVKVVLQAEGSELLSSGVGSILDH